MYEGESTKSFGAVTHSVVVCHLNGTLWRVECAGNSLKGPLTQDYPCTAVEHAALVPVAGDQALVVLQQPKVVMFLCLIGPVVELLLMRLILICFLVSVDPRMVQRKIRE